jgi:hypothetical protein
MRAGFASDLQLCNSVIMLLLQPCQLFIMGLTRLKQLKLEPLQLLFDPVHVLISGGIISTCRRAQQGVCNAASASSAADGCWQQHSLVAHESAACVSVRLKSMHLLPANPRTLQAPDHTGNAMRGCMTWQQQPGQQHASLLCTRTT